MLLESFVQNVTAYTTNVVREHWSYLKQSFITT